MMIPSYSLAPVFGISISEQRKIYFNHRNTLISLLSNTLIVYLDCIVVKSQDGGAVTNKSVAPFPLETQQSDPLARVG
ncbi:hypothetical protein [Symbiopectobacterium purcellii]|uniref:hypothetical protein n=1 Tax=Symbiopectobacterium purcellii TaxID=2871826 RepID=UPI003F82CCFF